MFMIIALHRLIKKAKVRPPYTTQHDKEQKVHCYYVFFSHKLDASFCDSRASDCNRNDGADIFSEIDESTCSYIFGKRITDGKCLVIVPIADGILTSITMSTCTVLPIDEACWHLPSHTVSASRNVMTKYDLKDNEGIYGGPPTKLASCAKH